MVDTEKLSALTEVKEEGSGINIMDAIKGISTIVKEVKGVQAEFKKNAPASNEPQTMDATPINAKSVPPMQTTQPQPMTTPTVQAPPVAAAPTVAPVKEAEKDVSGYFDKVVNMLEMGVLIYGDITVSAFKDEIVKDKAKIMLMIEKLM